MKKRITKRFVLHMGFSCNERCVFCYYRESLQKGAVKDHSTKNIKRKLKVARSYGKVEVDFSGGEPTIRKDLPELINYARKIGYEKVCIITNGLVMSRKDYCKKLLDAGLNDCLFSLHGPDAEMHDALTQVKGSWKMLLQAMQNMKDLKAYFRVNTVVNNLNFNRLEEHLALLKRYNPTEVNLICFNPAEETCRYRDDDVTVRDYNIIGENVGKVLNKYSKDFSVINVRFLPFCLVKGREKYIRTMYQKIYEKKEWDPWLFMRFRKGEVHAVTALLGGIFLSPFMLPKYGKRGFYTLFCEIVQLSRIFYNNKHVKKCKKCAVRRICPGLHRAYVKEINKTAVYPYKGKTIHDPLFFVDGFEDKFEDRS